MGFLSEFSNTTMFTKISKLARDEHKFPQAFNYWIDNLYERCLHLFEWEDLPIEPKEVEQRLLLDGKALFSNKIVPSKWVVVYCNGAVLDDVYFDEYKEYTYYSPRYTGQLPVDGIDTFLGSNNALRNSLYPLIHRYAILLAHTEVSLALALVNGRNKGIAVALSEKEKEELNRYYNNLCLGKIDTVVDKSFNGIEFRGFNDNGKLDIVDLMEVRKNLLYSFYEDIGVKTNYAKRGNMTDDEVNASDGLYLLNLKDMLAYREKIAEFFRSWGYNTTVSIAKEINYNDFDGGLVEDEGGVDNESEE